MTLISNIISNEIKDVSVRTWKFGYKKVQCYFFMKNLFIKYLGVFNNEEDFILYKEGCRRFYNVRASPTSELVSPKRQFGNHKMISLL